MQLQTLMPTSTHMRNQVIRTLASLRLHDNAQLAAQLSPHHLAVLRGVVEFGLRFLVNANNRVHTMHEHGRTLRTIREDVDRLCELAEVSNYKTLAESYGHLCRPIVPTSITSCYARRP